MKLIFMFSLLLFSSFSFAREQESYACAAEIPNLGVMQLNVEKFRIVNREEQVGIKFFLKGAPAQGGFFDVCTAKLGPENDRIYGCSEAESSDTMMFSLNREKLTGTLYAINEKVINVKFKCE